MSVNFDPQSLLSSFNSSLDKNFHIDLMSEQLDHWETVRKNLNYSPSFYLSSYIIYQDIYHRDIFKDTSNISIVIYSQNEPIGIWPLSVWKDKENNVLGSNFTWLLPPLFLSNIPNSVIKSISTTCMEVLENLAKDLNIKNFWITDQFQGGIGLSDWYSLCLLKSNEIKIYHELYSCLEEPLEVIRSNLRKSYKSLVNKAIKNLDIRFLKDSNEEIWIDFQKLHKSVAGRTTRSEETWNIQLKAISKGEAIFAYALDPNKKMIGGSLFYLTEAESFYAIGAYDRDLNHLFLGHALQYSAMLELKRMGVRWHRLGLYLTEGHDQISKKDSSISYFKKGFSSHVVPNFILKCKV